MRFNKQTLNVFFIVVKGSDNKDLKEIGELAGIETHLTTCVARHTFAIILKNKDISSRIIGEMMGHTDEKITEIYLKKFDNKVLDDVMSKLL